MSVTFAGLCPARQVIEINVLLDCLHEARPFAPLSSPSATWLERMEHAFSAGVRGDAYRELEELWLVFLARLPDSERQDLEQRLATFDRVLRVAPPEATSNGDLLVAMLDEALEQGRLA